MAAAAQTGLALLPALCAVAVYLPLWRRVEAFSFDDGAILGPIVNRRSSGFLWFWRCFGRKITEGPVRWAVYVSAWKLCGLQARGWLTCGMAWHALASALLVPVLITLGLSERVSLTVACLFAVHPMSVMTVASLGGWGSSLMWVGTLSSWLCVASGHWGAAVLLGVVTSLVKLDGWWVWPTMGIWWMIRP